MKTKLLFTVILALAFRLAPAQNTRFSTGIEAGPGLISMKAGHENYFKNPGVGFAAGIFIQYNAAKLFSLKLAPCFERKGQWNKIHNNFDYIVVPLLFRLEYGKGVRGFISAGPYCGYLLRSYIKASASYAVPPESEYSKNFNSFDAGISAGLGIIIQVQQVISLSVELRNNFGLYQIVKPAVSDEYVWTYYTYSGNLLISASWNFSKRKSK